MRILVALGLGLLIGCAAPVADAPSADALTGTVVAGARATTTARLNLRSGPSAAADVVRVLDAGTAVTIRAAAPENGFYAVQAGADEGYASGQFLVLDAGDRPASAGGDAVLYFHGMSHLGFSPAQVRSAVGDWAVLAPALGDAAIQGAVAESSKSFVAAHTTVVSGYSLGRIPVFRLMQQNAPGMRRVVMIDPTYDSASDLGRGIGGPIAKAWLAGDSSRSFLLVYGDSTVQLDGDDSYRAALADNPRAELCYVPGDHARFRQADMTAALVASGCEDLAARLAR